jgi:hypothetical protein
MMTRKEAIAGILLIAFALSLLSAMPGRVQAQSLSPGSEAQAVGGSEKCASAWGLGIGLAAGALGPCSILCLSLAWYDLVLIAAYCE